MRQLLRQLRLRCRLIENRSKRHNDGEVLARVQRRRGWTPEEKVRIVEETYLPGMSVSLVAHRHGIGAGQLFTRRRFMAQGALTADGTGEEVVSASEYGALKVQVRELQRLPGKKAMENELLREAVSRAAAPKNALALNLVARGHSVTAVAAALGIARPHLSATRNRPPP